MNIRQFFLDKKPVVSLLAKAYAATNDFLLGVFARAQSSRQAPDDFATRPSIPLPEEYEAASNAQILDRLYRNPAGLLNEQPFIDTLMNVRNTENNQKQTKYVVFGFYVLAFSTIVLAFRPSPTPTPEPPGQAAERQHNAEKALENAVSLLKEEFNLKLQSKDIEIKDLKRQISLLSQGQAELTKQIKSVAKKATPAASPPVISKPQKPNPAPHL